jgi:hypothetical protein
MPSTVAKVSARSVRVGDRIPVTLGAPYVRLSDVAGLTADGFTVATVTATEYRPLDFQLISTDVHDGPLVFLTDEQVVILPRADAS